MKVIKKKENQDPPVPKGTKEKMECVSLILFGDMLLTDKRMDIIERIAEYF